MKKSAVLSLVVLSGLAFNAEAYTMGEELTGDTKLACEAILCLSTSSRPSECSSAISRYFSIKMRKPHDTFKARLNFLKLCPADLGDKEELAKIGIDKDEQEKGLNTLTNAIANLPHDCLPETLNKQIQSRKICRDCDRVYRIKPTLPQACRDLAKHQWTIVELPVYKGDYSWSTNPYPRPVWFLEKVENK